MAKFYTIDACKECVPYFRKSNGEIRCTHPHLLGVIDDENAIPSGCPLPDLPDHTEAFRVRLVAVEELIEEAQQDKSE